MGGLLASRDGLQPDLDYRRQHHGSAAPPARTCQTDTQAKLTLVLQHGNLPSGRGGRLTSLIIDEAGMADTPHLDTAVQFAIGRRASVRLGPASCSSG